MAWQIPISTSQGATVAPLGTSDDLFVASGVTIASALATTVTGGGSDHEVIVYGSIVGVGLAILLGELDRENNSVHIKPGGSVHSLETDAIVFLSYGSTVINEGLITADRHGIVVETEGLVTQATLTNSGTIEAGNAGIIRNSTVSNEPIVVENSGLIRGGVAAYDGRSQFVAKDLVTNTGTMVGKVELGSGDDLYDGRLGTISCDVLGGSGSDRLYAGAGNNRLFGGEGNDSLIGGAGADRLDGGTGIDTVSYVGSSAVTVSLTTGVALGGHAAGDTLVGIENLIGSSQADALSGNAGDNVLNDGGGAADILHGLAGNDTYRIGNSGAIVDEVAGQGTDTVMTSVDYTLKTGVSVEVLRTYADTGSIGVDLTGNEIAQTVRGNAGANILDGKGGADTLQGLGGKDFFVFSAALGAGNVDTVTDFNVVDDTIRLENAVFTKLTTTGALSSTMFRASSAGTAADGNDFIVYDTDDGRLFYDADGVGSGGRVHFATLTGAPALTAGDFAVI